MWTFFLLLTNFLCFASLSEDCPSSCNCDMVYKKLFIYCTQNQTIFNSLPQSNNLHHVEYVRIRSNLELIPLNICQYKKLTTIDLEYNMLKELKIFECNLLESLQLSNNQISSVNSDDFTSLQNLSILSLSNNRITQVSFKNLKSLRYIYLNDNKMSVLNNFSFIDLSTLQWLYLSSNQITLVDRNAFKNLFNLYYLDLSGNRLTQIESNTFNGMPNLGTLLLSNNQIKEISSDAWLNLPFLINLHLSNNKITKIPKNLFNVHLQNLFFINLSHNLLTEMELWPLNLPKIWFIDLQFNQIKKFTNYFKWYFSNNSYLPALATNARFDLSFNKIETFDDHTIQQYGVCSFIDYKLFISNYYNAFFFQNNSIFCDCSTQKRLISDSKWNITLSIPMNIF